MSPKLKAHLNKLKQEAQELKEETTVLQKVESKDQNIAEPAPDPLLTMQLQISEYQAQIQDLKEKLTQTGQQLEQSQLEGAEMAKKMAQLEHDCQQKTLILARTEGYYSTLFGKNSALKDQVQRLKQNVITLSLRLKNTVSASDTMKSAREAADTHEREAMSKMIRHYEQQLYPQHERQGDPFEVRKLIELVENQQADIDKLLAKMVQREEEYRNALATNKEAVKLEMEEAKLGEEICFHIETSLKKSERIDRELFEAYSAMAAENAQLLKCLQQRKEHDLAQDSIQRYSRELEKMCLELNRKLQEEDNEKVRRSQASEREQREKKAQEEEVSRLKETVAIEQQKRQETEKNYTLLQLKLKNKENELEKSISACRNLGKQIEEQSKKFEIERMSQSLTINSAPRSQFSNQQNHLSRTEQHRPLTFLATSEILITENAELRKRLIEVIGEAHPSARISKTKLIFREDQFHRSFSPYLTTPMPLLILVRIDENCIVGGFAFLTLPESSSLANSVLTVPQRPFLFKAVSEKVQCFHAENGVEEVKALTFGEGWLNFGRNELVVRDGKVKLSVNYFGKSYYQRLDTSEIPKAEEGSRGLSYQQLEIHTVDFRT